MQTHNCTFHYFFFLTSKRLEGIIGLRNFAIFPGTLVAILVTAFGHCIVNSAEREAWHDQRMLTTSNITRDLPEIQRILCTHLLAPGAQERGDALTTIGTMCELVETSIPFIIPLLTDQRPFHAEPDSPHPIRHTVAGGARIALISLGGKAVPACLESLSKHKGDEIHIELIGVLGAIRDAAAQPALAAALADDSPEVVSAAVRSVRGWADSSFIPALVRESKSSSVAARRDAFRALSYYTDPFVVAVLMQATEHADALVRCHVVSGLAIQGSDEPFQKALAVMWDPNEGMEVRSCVAFRLAASSNPLSTRTLETVLEDKLTPNLLRMWAMAGIKSQIANKVDDIVLRIAGDRSDNEGLRRTAIEVLVDCDGTDVRSLLKSIADSPLESPRMRFFAVQGLVRVVDGAISDEDYLSVIDRWYVSPQPGDDHLKVWLMRRVVNNGSTLAIRARARAYLETWRVGVEPKKSR